MSGSDAASWELKLGGQPLSPEVKANLVEIEVLRRLDHASRFCLKLSDPDCALVDSATFALGAAVTVTLRHSGRDTPVFDGELTAWGLERTTKGTVFLVRGLDRSHRLLRSRRIRFVEAADDVALVRALAKDHGLTTGPGGSAPAGKSGPTGQLQLGSSDLSLLLGRGERLARAPGLDGKTLRLEPPAYSKPPYQLQNGETVLRFELQAELSQLPTQALVVGWDMRQHRRIEGKAAAMDLKWTGGSRQTGLSLARRAFGEAIHILAEHQPQDAQEAKQLAAAYLQHRVERTLQGVVWLTGFPGVAPGQRIQLEGPEMPLPGAYLVTAVHALLTAAGGSTRLEVIRPHIR